jgi:hypothetical protein
LVKLGARSDPYYDPYHAGVGQAHEVVHSEYHVGVQNCSVDSSADWTIDIGAFYASWRTAATPKIDDENIEINFFAQHKAPLMYCSSNGRIDTVDAQPAATPGLGFSVPLRDGASAQGNGWATIGQYNDWTTTWSIQITAAQG